MNRHYPLLRRSRPLLYTFAILAVGLGFAALSAAKPWWMRGVASNEEDFLPPDVAFRVGAHIDGEVIRVRWVIADGYYLYRNKIDVRAESPDLIVHPAQLPPGTHQMDPLFGMQEVYLQQVEATVPFQRMDFGAHPLEIKVSYQGCAQAGLCYPVISKAIFPENSAQPILMTPTADARPRPWQTAAILGGSGAFLLAGLWLRKGRRLPTPGP